ncbi:MAG: glycosyltransferase family protein [Spirochaetes bacterium]|nr:glycosyltransferase family protein [Spirochaetota bacterium]
MTKPRVVAIVQARMASTRLSGKALLPLAGKPIVYRVLERAMSIPSVDCVVLAIPQKKEDEKIIEAVTDLSISIFQGSEENVLERFYLAAEKFSADIVVRITADNPFTDVEYGNETVLCAIENKSDLCAPLGLPLGCAVEVISFAALEIAHRLGHLPYHREHVSPYIKERPEEFSIVRFPVAIEPRYASLRLTVDTEEDYRLASLLYDALYKGKPFPLQQTLSYLDAHPELIEINKHVAQRPMTHYSGGFT